MAVYGISQKRFDLNDPTLFHQLVTEVLSPVQEGLANSKKSLSSLWDNYMLIVNTSKENNVLKKQISRLESDLTTMEEVRKDQALDELLRRNESSACDGPSGWLGLS